MNRELDADFDPDAFAHVARFDPVEEWIEMRLRAQREQRVTIAKLELDVHFADGEELRTEISAKFRRERVERELATAGLELAAWWTDPDDDFALSLSFPAWRSGGASERTAAGRVSRPAVSEPSSR